MPPGRVRRGGREPGHGTYKRKLNPKIHLAVDAFGMPVRMFIASGTVADCAIAGRLIEGVDVDYLLADKAYDTNEIPQAIKALGAEAVIPPKKNRKERRGFGRVFTGFATSSKTPF